MVKSRIVQKSFTFRKTRHNKKALFPDHSEQMLVSVFHIKLVLSLEKRLASFNKFTY